MTRDRGTPPIGDDVADAGNEPPIPAGWRRVLVDGQDVLMLTDAHPDYPSELRDRASARDEVEFGKDPAVKAALGRLADQFANAEEMLLVQATVALAKTRDLAAVNAIVDGFSAAFFNAVTEESRKLPPTNAGRRRQAYLMRRAHELLPPNVATALEATLAPYSAPFLVLVNTTNEPIKPVVEPSETMIRLDRFMIGDLPKLGRIITDAQRLTGQTDRPRKGGRPKLPDMSTEAATPEMVAKLRHWEGWSYRRIAAFLGWLRPDEDWRNEQTRRRVEQRVRRWVREGERGLRSLTPPDQDWKRRPGHVDRAVKEERPRV